MLIVANLPLCHTMVSDAFDLVFSRKTVPPYSWNVTTAP